MNEEYTQQQAATASCNSKLQQQTATFVFPLFSDEAKYKDSQTININNRRTSIRSRSHTLQEFGHRSPLCIGWGCHLAASVSVRSESSVLCVVFEKKMTA